MKQIEVVAAIIHDADGRIFATQRGYGDFKDLWEFPDGERRWGCLGVILAVIAIVLLIMLALGAFAAVLDTGTSVSGGSLAMAFG